MMAFNSRTRQGNGGMMVLIFLAIFTIAFGAAAFMQNTAIKEQRKGDSQGTIKPTQSLVAVNDNIFKAQQDISKKETRLAELNKATHYYDREIAALGEFYRAPYKDPEGTIVPGEFIGLANRADGTPFTHHNQANKLIQHQHDILKMWEAHFGSAARQDTPELKQAASDFREATNEIDREGGEAEENILGTIDRLQEELDKLRDRRSKIEADYRLQSSIKQTRKNQLEAKIRRLLELELRWMTSLESDGNILQTGVDYNFIIVNIGNKEGVQSGMRFEIFNHDKGQYKRKGMCEVIKVESTISTCRVMIEDDKKYDPIAIGDHIGNPVFDAHDPKTFVLAGEFKMFNKSDLEYFIKQAGGQVSPVLKPGVDFLVASHRSEEAQDNAREYDLLAMDEATLVKYLDTTFTVPDKK